MKKLLIGLVLLLGSMAISCTPTETASEHHRRLLLTGDIQMRSAVDDWDSFWLCERASRLTRWHVRYGH